MVEDFPRTLGEFEERFASEEACREFLKQARWPEGFRCACCQDTRAWVNARNLLVCQGCGKQVSLTAGTVLQGTRKPLRDWFRAMWWVCTQKTGGSAKGLQRLLGLGSYQTAWVWLHKLRTAMIRAAREPLEGPVEVDDAFIGGEEAGVRGRETLKKAKITVAVEIPGTGRRQMGRIRLLHVPDFSAGALLPFVCENVQLGSRVITDGWEGYAGLKSAGYRHEVKKGHAKLLAHVHLVIGLLKRWLQGTHHGAVRPKQLQYYLEEFTFRYNRRKSHDVGRIFYRIIQGSAVTRPISYRQIAARPEKPGHVPYNI
jgi:transposase-like protein